ncbi:protein-export chaperone SecB [Parvibaculum sp.]|uniref:protein-export chaperone SecB n=1 Tax=Parvibaculum sp. TaxID=2024848 RepID=UPI002B6DB253|nr:protein-export chaperone SecB [Parvibaculum sp.]HUD50356.1 protein-export chaperone SecB [Parvibaculum sp.]
MSDENAQDPQISEEAAPQLRVLTQYIRDLSFENPNAPRTLGALAQPPQIAVRVDVNVQRLSQEDFEITLAVGVEAKAAEEAMFLVELQYCGLFRLANIPAEQLEPVLLIECPRQIFPFARRIIADVTRDGGFPPLMIDPIDFVALYQQRRSEGNGQLN